MTRIRLTALVLAAAVAGLLLWACSDNPTETKNQGQIPSGTCVGYDGCNTPPATTSGDGVQADQTCIEYEYDGESVLSLKHVNAVFNCCPDSVGGEVTIDGQDITIDEAEWLTMPCFCICPYDVDYEIVNLPPGEYTIKVNELYLPEGADLLEFTVDLVASPSGVFCVDRSLPRPIGRTIGFDGCKGLTAAASIDGTPSGQACVEYEYDGESVLSLRHVNGVFNCCPDSVGGEITIDGQNITIDEVEWLTMPCDCICPFDVDYEIVNLPPGEYTICVNEVYVSQGAEPLEFTVDLVTSPTGVFCVDRDLPMPSGIVTGYTGCKTFDSAALRGIAPPNQDCIEYEYDGEAILKLTHINSGFNCCPDALTAEFEIDGQQIVIDEAEVLTNGCHCLCLFDLECEIVNLPAGTYTVTVNQLYLQEGDQILEFTVDLVASPTGTVCVERDHYPWGN